MKSQMKRGNLCIVYVSEAARVTVLNQLYETAGDHLLHTFRDITYNRSSFYLCGPNLLEKATEVCKLAFRLLDYGAHTGTHPALGSVDNICFSPLGDQPHEETVSLAKDFCAKLYSIEKIPILNYGFASATNRSLRDLRKDLGYFSQNSTEIMTNPEMLSRVGVDYGGPQDLNVRKGVSCVGVVPYIVNFNMRFRNQDSKRLVSQITKFIRTPEVQALTLPHVGGSYEVACNLLNPKSTTPADLIERVSKKSVELGIEVEYAYTTGPTEEDLLEQLARTDLSVGRQTADLFAS